VTAELTYILGKLNETKFPKVKVQRKTTASMEQKWRCRKRPTRYSDAPVASKWLKTIHRQLTPTATAAPVKGEAASAAEHIAMDTTRKMATTVSTTANVQMKELGDGDSMTAMGHLCDVYPDVDGLQQPSE